jgi:hypothetical protein
MILGDNMEYNIPMDEDMPYCDDFVELHDTLKNLSEEDRDKVKVVIDDYDLVEVFFGFKKIFVAESRHFVRAFFGNYYIDLERSKHEL